MHIKIPIQLREALPCKTCFFEYSLGGGIVEMGERLDDSEPETFVREIEGRTWASSVASPLPRAVTVKV
jgi:hypothetical protein